VRRPATPAEWSESAALLHDHAEWIRHAARFEPLHEQPAFAAELADLPGHYSGPHAVLFLARLDGFSAGVVAVRFHPDGSAELKRMYVRPVARGRGVADELVAAVIAAAEARDCTAVWLETLRGTMDRAIAMYRRNGFVESDGTGAAHRTLEVEGVVVMEHRLGGARRAGGRS
jgi:GNAT superfamily N-acetyltransferase